STAATPPPDPALDISIVITACAPGFTYLRRELLKTIPRAAVVRAAGDRNRAIRARQLRVSAALGMRCVSPAETVLNMARASGESTLAQPTVSSTAPSECVTADRRSATSVAPGAFTAASTMR